MTTVLCITGMHRSGTSLAANWLERCDLAIADGRMLGPGVGNPHGHFEDLDISDIQDRAIRRTHGSWRARTAEPLSFDAGELEEITRLVARRNAVYPAWGWKDPRTVMFLHQWKRLIPRLRVLIVWRPCAEVVDSLTARARMAPPDLDMTIRVRQAVQVWRSYNTAVCAFIRDWPDDVMLVPIATLIRGDRALLDDLNRRWHLELPHTPIDLVRDQALLTRRARLLSRIAAWTGHAATLERELERLSWRSAVPFAAPALSPAREAASNRR